MLYSCTSEVQWDCIIGGDDMEKNVGSIDRNIRIILGIVFMTVGLFIQGGTGIKIGAFTIAAIAFATAFLNFCPLWKVLGISTSKKEKAERIVESAEKQVQHQEKTEEDQAKPAGHS